MNGKIGQNVTILIESLSRNDKNELFGHTEANEMAVIEGNLDRSLIGNFVNAKIKEVKGKTFRCIKE